MELFTLLFSWRGRINRKPFTIIVLLVHLILLMRMSVTSNIPDHSPELLDYILLPLVWFSLMAQIKRWHDLDRSGWWILVNFIPFVGTIYAMFVQFGMRGTFGDNRFGPDPIPNE